MIATYALCGFANFISVGIGLGIIGGMAPTRKPLLARLALRSLMAGSISTFLTASLAGVLVDKPIACPSAAATANASCVDLAQVRRMLVSWARQAEHGS